MPEYRTIARPVVAIPWIATADGSAAVFAWAERLGGIAVHQRSGYLGPRYVDTTGRRFDEVMFAYDHIDQRGRGAIVYPGDWLVREAGHFHALDDAAFRQRYEEVPA